MLVMGMSLSLVVVSSCCVLLTLTLWRARIAVKFCVPSLLFVLVLVWVVCVWIVMVGLVGLDLALLSRCCAFNFMSIVIRLVGRCGGCLVGLVGWPCGS